MVNKTLDQVILVLLHGFTVAEFVKLFQCIIQLFIIAQIKMRAHEVMHAFNIMAAFYAGHMRGLIKQINPFLCVPVVLQKILAYEGLPAITLV